METKERPILFNAQMVLAILEGRKTQTRRVIKPQPILSHGVWVYDNRCFFDDMAMQSHLFHDVYGKSGSPYGSIYGDGSADRLWVQETWQATGHDLVTYRADETTRQIDDWQACEKKYLATLAGRWQPSSIMPRWASRFLLYLVDVRIERVQDISAEDCEAEGLAKDGHGFWMPGGYAEHGGAILAFRDLWDSINAKRGYSWNSNPWVWVVEFHWQN